MIKLLNGVNLEFLQSFVFGYQQNKNIVTWEIKGISNVVKNWNSNAYKNLILHLLFDKNRQTNEESWFDLFNLRYKKLIFYVFQVLNLNIKCLWKNCDFVLLMLFKFPL